MRLSDHLEPKPLSTPLQAEAAWDRNEEAGPSLYGSTASGRRAPGSQEPVCRPAFWKVPTWFIPKASLCLGLNPHLEMLSVSPWGSSQGDPGSVPGPWQTHRKYRWSGRGASPLQLPGAALEAGVASGPPGEDLKIALQ